MDEVQSSPRFRPIFSALESAFRNLPLPPEFPGCEPLYKFVSRRYLDAFFNTGSVRIGTTESFKDTVEHGQSRADLLEGRHAVLRAEDNFFHDGREELVISPSVRFGPGVSVQIRGSKFITRSVFPDSYIFCTAKFFSEEAFLRWNASEGTDACYEISNYAVYRNALTQALDSHAFWYSDSYINYVDEMIDYRLAAASAPAIFSKRREYEWQMEHRSVWRPRGPFLGVKPKVLAIPTAVRVCRPVAFIENGKVKYV